MGKHQWERVCFWHFGCVDGRLGVFAFSTLFWNLAGKEIIILSRDVLKVERKVFGIGSNHEYLLTKINNLRALEGEKASTSSSENPWQSDEGTIAFDYGIKTIKFAQSIDTAEAEYIVEKIKAKLMSNKMS